jgi:hypothetical protein
MAGERPWPAKDESWRWAGVGCRQPHVQSLHRSLGIARVSPSDADF